MATDCTDYTDFINRKIFTSCHVERSTKREAETSKLGEATSDI